MRGEVLGRAVWIVARRGSALQIVDVEYDVVPQPPAAPLDG
jgi:hypothetical protein